MTNSILPDLIIKLTEIVDDINKRLVKVEERLNTDVYGEIFSLKKDLGCIATSFAEIKNELKNATALEVEVDRLKRIVGK